MNKNLELALEFKDKDTVKHIYYLKISLKFKVYILSFYLTYKVR